MGPGLYVGIPSYLAAASISLLLVARVFPLPSEIICFVSREIV